MASTYATVFYNEYPNATDTDEIESIRAEQLANITALTDMSAANTLIIGVVSESPYAESMGDINNPFCQNPSAYDENGCDYVAGENPYMPVKQSNSLKLGYEQNSLDVIDAVRDHDSEIPLITV